jgi:hypothetical protein
MGDPNSPPFGHEPLWLTLREKRSGPSLAGRDLREAVKEIYSDPGWAIGRSAPAVPNSRQHARPAWCSRHGRTNRDGGRSEVS